MFCAKNACLYMKKRANKSSESMLDPVTLSCVGLVCPYAFDILVARPSWIPAKKVSLPVHTLCLLWFFGRVQVAAASILLTIS